MTDTIDNFVSAGAAVQKMAQGNGAGYKRGMNQVFNLAAALRARGINLGAGIDDIGK